MQETPFIVENSAGEKLACVLSLPEDEIEEPLPLVLLLHGFAWNKEEDGLFIEIPKRLTKLGYSCVRFDFSGCGESDGDYSKTTLTKLVNDAKTVLEYLSKSQLVDTNKLSVIGQSFGTSVSIALDEEVQRIVLMGSFHDPYESLSSGMDKFVETGISFQKRSNGSTTYINGTFWKDFRNYSLVEIVSKKDAPILFIHGLSDTAVPPKEMEPLFAAAKNPKKVLLEGANHGLIPKREEVYEAIEEFFQPETEKDDTPTFLSGA